jgi:hypothetical protein
MKGIGVSMNYTGFEMNSNRPERYTDEQKIYFLGVGAGAFAIASTLQIALLVGYMPFGFSMLTVMKTALMVALVEIVLGAVAYGKCHRIRRSGSYAMFCLGSGISKFLVSLIVILSPYLS